MAPSSAAQPPPLLRVEHLTCEFARRGSLFARRPPPLRAVDDVSLEIAAGRTLGVVGESGCGKSTLARGILRLIPAAGRILFDGLDWTALPPGALRRARSRMQLVFQDPSGSLNPRLSVGEIVSEGLRPHGLAHSSLQARALAAEAMQRVGLSAGDMAKHPHEFSGGQKQRIGIARAIALRPRLLICDEPTSALDVSIQAQILNLLAELRDVLALSYLFISHNLAVVRLVCEDVAVMYRGRIVEQAPSATLFARPRHPYTRLLLAAAADMRSVEAAVQAGTAQSSPVGVRVDGGGLGCGFAGRCPHAQPRCVKERPTLMPLRDDAGARVACHFAEEIRN